MPGIRTYDWYKSNVIVDLTWDYAVPPSATQIRHTCELDLPAKFEYNTNQQWEKIHGFSAHNVPDLLNPGKIKREGEWNAGVTRKIPTYEWTLTVPSVSASCRALRTLMSVKQPFTINIKDIETSKADSEWELYDEIFNKSYVTSMGAEYEIEEVPMIDFTGISFEYDYNGASLSVSEIAIAADPQLVTIANPDIAIRGIGSGIMTSGIPSTTSVAKKLDLLWEEDWV